MYVYCRTIYVCVRAHVPMSDFLLSCFVYWLSIVFVYSSHCSALLLFVCLSVSVGCSRLSLKLRAPSTGMLN